MIECVASAILMSSGTASGHAVAGSCLSRSLVRIGGQAPQWYTQLLSSLHTCTVRSTALVGEMRGTLRRECRSHAELDMTPSTMSVVTVIKSRTY
jgi:hypothetical protein